MIRLLLTLALLFSFSFAQTSVDTKIKKTSTKLSKYSKNHRNINKKVAQNARKILKLKKELYKQQELAKKLKEELEGKESSYNSNKQQLSTLAKTKLC